MTAEDVRRSAAKDWLAELRSADGLFAVDERQRIVHWSPVAERVLG